MRCSLPSDCAILKIKWIQGISEPTLIYLAKSSSADTPNEYFIDVARVNAQKRIGFEFELKMRQTFNDGVKVMDFDCQNISHKQFVVSTVENGCIRLYSLSFESDCL